MALEATEQGSRPPAGAADTDPARRPLAVGGTGGSKRAAVAGIPDDALVEILSRLPAKFLSRSKCVSKAWCDLIADRLRCRKLPHTLEGFFCCVDEFPSDGSWTLSSDDDEESSSEDDEESSSEDGKEGGSGNNGKCGSGDGDEGGDGKDEKPLTHHVPGHFINLMGRSVPLVDPLFSFLRKQPGIHNLILIDSCNGLLLFGHLQKSVFCNTTSYIVYNPATEHWLLVPSSSFTSIPLEMDESDDDDDCEYVLTCLIFDPVASSHFQLIEFCRNQEVSLVCTYSSETKRWNKKPREPWRWKKGGEWDLHRTITSMRGRTVFNKMLHLMVNTSSVGPELIAVIDGKGKTSKVIPWVESHGFPIFVGQSQGLLHCLSVSGRPDGNSCHMTELSIWVLEDYNAEEWNLKHTVSFLELFGKRSCQFGSDYNVATIHPDQNLVFFVQLWDHKLISYDMDRKKVGALCTVGRDHGVITPYVPYFSETPMLSKKH